MFSDVNGCLAKDSVKVNVIRDIYLFVPNAFTPNNDGRNDVFRATTNLKEAFRLMIYNRWGEVVFQSKNPGEGWNGTCYGVLQPAGTYVYHLQIKMPNGKMEFRKGTFVLVY